MNSIFILYMILRKMKKKVKNTVTINGTEYTVKYTIRALFIFEQITNKPFKIETLLDNYIFFYSMLLASNKDNVLQWDDFIDALDADRTLFQKLNDIVAENEKARKVFEDNAPDPDGEKKVKHQRDIRYTCA